MAASKQKKDDPFVVTFEERGDQTIVRKSNDLVQMTRNNLTLSQQRLMLHIFSMIKPEDTDLPSYELSIYDFIKMTGMDPHSGALYKQVRKNIEELANAPIQWIKNNGTSTVETFRWIDKVRIDEGRARMTITLDPVLKPHLVQLKTLYTTMDVTYTMLMRSTYSIRIYELCKSYQSLYLKKKAAGEPLVWNLSMLYEQLSYTANRWSDFRRLALEMPQNHDPDPIRRRLVHGTEYTRRINLIPCRHILGHALHGSPSLVRRHEGLNKFMPQRIRRQRHVRHDAFRKQARRHCFAELR